MISQTTALVAEVPITASADPAPTAGVRFLGFTPASSRPNPSTFPGANASNGRVVLNSTGPRASGLGDARHRHLEAARLQAGNEVVAHRDSRREHTTGRGQPVEPKTQRTLAQHHRGAGIAGVAVGCHGGDVARPRRGT